jgi:uncharacterized membrane protein HdeD (DUF308 family)
MAKLTIGIGVALVVLGVGAFALTQAKTSLIPAYFGVPLVVCGAAALNEAYRKHAMHVAVVIGLLGFLMPLGRLIPVLVQGRRPAPMALISLLAMMALCGVFVVLCVRSFIAARRARTQGPAVQ